MKIDVDVIRAVLYSIDPDAKNDPEFVSTVNYTIAEMEQKQRDKEDGKESN
tara:strand:+ start:366 stop:518 length:153 start_codon:yes stop_codon:yes gene_type:complete